MFIYFNQGVDGTVCPVVEMSNICQILFLLHFICIFAAQSAKISQSWLDVEKCLYLWTEVILKTEVNVRPLHR